MNPFASASFPIRQHLGRNQFLHIERPPVLRLRAERGTLWVTVDGSPDDIEIDAGESRVFDVREPITVGTLGGDAVLSATALTPPNRLLGWWQALLTSLRQPAVEVWR